MTKCIVLGEQAPKTEKKQIQFIAHLTKRNRQFDYNNACQRPSTWDNIELISKENTFDKLDIMYAYKNNKRNDGYLYIGHWNDGIV